ncbi:MAG: DNA recombination protein RmuC, partial [Bacteriovorax sp.]|nr:DNA recombination protein RmuC [Rhizobacter sp.]
MPFDWIFFALLVLLLLLVLWLTLRRADPRALQHLERELRDEVARSAALTRQELAQTLSMFQQSLLTQQG